MTEVFIGLGSNVGDKARHLSKAISLLDDDEHIRKLRVSSFYRTEPIGVENQNWFVNAAAFFETSFSARELLNKCLDIERALKRERRERWGPRTLDIDVLLYGDSRIEEEGLMIPHPRIGERAFVLKPLMELNPSLTINQKPIAQLLLACQGQIVEKLQ